MRLFSAFMIGTAFLWPLTAADAPVKKEPPPADAKWTALFDGKTLTGWKAPNYGTQGEVEVKDGAITLNFGDGITGATYEKDFPTTGYELEVEAARLDGNDFFCGLTFPVNKSHLTFVVGGWGGTVVGLSNLDGQDAANNETSRFMEFKTKQWYKVRVRVTADSVRTWIDDERINNVDLRDREIGLRAEVDLSKPLGLTAWKTIAAMRSVRYRLLSKAEVAEMKPKEE